MIKATARCFLINENNKILLVKHGEDRSWTLPGGHLENGENPYIAIKREIKEEFNIDIEIIGKKNGIQEEIINEYPLPLSVYEITYEHAIHGKVTKIDYIFLAKSKSTDIEIQEEEIYDYKWFYIDEAKQEEYLFSQIKTILKNNEDLFK